MGTEGILDARRKKLVFPTEMALSILAYWNCAHQGH